MSSTGMVDHDLYSSIVTQRIVPCDTTFDMTTQLCYPSDFKLMGYFSPKHLSTLVNIRERKLTSALAPKLSDNFQIYTNTLVGLFPLKEMIFAMVFVEFR